jgi:hypothetical protein
MLADGLDERSTFGNAEVQRFFRVDIQTAQASHDRRANTYVIGCGDHHCVQVFRVVHLLIVLVGRPPWLGLDASSILRGQSFYLREIAVANGDQFGTVPFPRQRPGQPPGPRAGPNETNANLAIGTVSAMRGEHRRRNQGGKRQRGRGRRSQEVSSRTGVKRSAHSQYLVVCCRPGQ